MYESIQDHLFYDSLPPALPPPVATGFFKFGFIVRPGSFWIGAHWSKHNRRWCINLVPCVTFWVTLPGGKTP